MLEVIPIGKNQTLDFMKKICFVTNGTLPVPAINGGAIEQLIEILIRENEKNHLFDFTIVGLYNKDLDIEISKYKYTSFSLKKINSTVNRLFWWKIRGALKKIIHKDYYQVLPYNRFAEKYLFMNCSLFDLIICEGAEVSIF